MSNVARGGLLVNSWLGLFQQIGQGQATGSNAVNFAGYETQPQELSLCRPRLRRSHLTAAILPILASLTSIYRRHDVDPHLYFSQPLMKGFYQFAQLDPGSYTVRFEARGFKTAVRKSVSVVAPSFTNLNVALTIGDTGGGGVEIKK
jgi:hypothetical protein